MPLFGRILWPPRIYCSWRTKLANLDQFQKAMKQEAQLSVVWPEYNCTWTLATHFIFNK